MGKLFIIIGIVFVLLGLVWTFMGRLPGDVNFKKGNVTFYFPVMTSILVSVILSVIFYLINRFR